MHCAGKAYRARSFKLSAVGQATIRPHWQRIDGGIPVETGRAPTLNQSAQPSAERTLAGD